MPGRGFHDNSTPQDGRPPPPTITVPIHLTTVGAEKKEQIQLYTSCTPVPMIPLGSHLDGIPFPPTS